MYNNKVCQILQNYLGTWQSSDSLIFELGVATDRHTVDIDTINDANKRIVCW